MDERASNAIQTKDREARLFQEIRRIPLTFAGPPIVVRFQPGLTAHRGKLLSGAGIGQPVLAGSFLRKREIVLDSTLLRRSSERGRILVHELFHFVWARLGNPRRAAWSALLKAEVKAHARGELGWSSEWRKNDSAPWPEYICESFCDTAAWAYGAVKEHGEFTLASRWRVRRRQWFAAFIDAHGRVKM